MNINEIMGRDLTEEAGDDLETQRSGGKFGFPWFAVAVWIAFALAALAAAFTAGMCYQSHRALKADRDFAAWYERVEREATERARAMGTNELLNATERNSAGAADR